MLKIKNYMKAESLEQAYELNQKRTACVLGGMVWLKMGNRIVTTAIDLSGLGLDTITETESEFVIGCMTPLRDLDIYERCHKRKPAPYCRRTVPQLRYCRWKYLGTLWLF